MQKFTCGQPLIFSDLMLLDIMPLMASMIGKVTLWIEQLEQLVWDDTITFVSFLMISPPPPKDIYSSYISHRNCFVIFAWTGKYKNTLQFFLGCPQNNKLIRRIESRKIICLSLFFFSVETGQRPCLEINQWLKNGKAKKCDAICHTVILHSSHFVYVALFIAIGTSFIFYLKIIIQKLI